MKILAAAILPLFDLLACLAVRGFFGIVRLLPDRVSLVLLRGCVRLLLVFMPRSHAVGIRNLELIFPDKSPEERRKILKDSYEALARHLLAISKIPMLTPETAAEMFDYSEVRPVWNRARSRAPAGTGCIIVTAHFGSFELLVQAHALLDRPLSVLSRPFALPRLERYWKSQRERFGNIQFSRDGGYREIVRQLRSGRDVLLVMDQNVRVHHAEFVSFFGIPAATSKSPALAAIRTGAPLFFAACAEEEPFRYKMLFADLGCPDDYPGDSNQKVRGIIEAIHREFEKAIEQYPGQWMWIHRRFKTRPVGEVESLYGGRNVTTW